jgi:hypothetical protein
MDAMKLENGVSAFVFLQTHRYIGNIACDTEFAKIVSHAMFPMPLCVRKNINFQ